MKTSDLVYCSIFTVLIAVGAFIKIPIPVVPFTLQVLFTTMSGLLLGAKLGAVSVGMYIFSGLIGLPVFTEGGGIWYLFKPSFGYIIGFLIGSYVTGKIAEKLKQPTIPKYLAANLAGLSLIYAFGMVYYYFICNFVIDTPIDILPLFLYCFILVVPGDICLCILAAILAKRLRPILQKQVLK